MKKNLNELLIKLGEDYKDILENNSRHYLAVSIAEKAAEQGLTEVEKRFKDVFAIVPLKYPLPGMKVRIDGRTFVNYAQFNFGIVVPSYVARQADLSSKAYVARDSMVRNFF